ncbi:hypothetical protein [Curtobacterium sp. TXMA1]|uniref:hypothetical protein n=1 Tax=Curtobacterium sp. TXMA1 TaxID=2876939 RepID=UPI001CCB1B9E|nr:hypothetical protein [Curtobacterium sp. TXMA1]UBQ02774.1 hypothetical protein LCG91_00965 [Curtobacterium sp. TXMA1]
MTGANEPLDPPSIRKRDNSEPDEPTQNPSPRDPRLQAARELGKHLANGVAFSGGKRLVETAMDDIEQNPDDNFFTRLINWIQSLQT